MERIPKDMATAGETANYIKLDGRLFAITPIKAEVDLEAELKSFYNEKYNKHVENVNTTIGLELSGEWDNQLDRIRKFTDKSSVTIPDNLHGKYVISSGTMVEEVRPVLYSPDVFKMLPMDVAPRMNIEWHRSITNGRTKVVYESTFKIGDKEIDLNVFAADATLIVKVKHDIRHIALYSFNAKADRLACYNLHTFHNQSTLICTGSNRASQFWNSPDFDKLMNQVNCFSLANHAVQYSGRDNQCFTLNDYVNSDTIVSLDVEERSSTWTT